MHRHNTACCGDVRPAVIFRDVDGKELRAVSRRDLAVLDAQVVEARIGIEKLEGSSCCVPKVKLVACMRGSTSNCRVSLCP